MFGRLKNRIATHLSEPEQKQSSDLISNCDIPVLYGDKIIGGRYTCTVFTATYKDTAVAVKLLVDGYAETDLETRCQHHVHILSHLNFAQRKPIFYGYYYSHGNPALVMEHFPYNLATFLAKNPYIDWHSRYKLSLAATLCLDELHNEYYVVHRQLKPRKFVLDASYRVKIIGFGKARIAKEIAELEFEQEKKSDIYKLGTVFSKVAACHEEKKPIEGHSETIPATCPQKFATLIAKCWSGQSSTKDIIAELTALEHQTLPRILSYEQLIFNTYIGIGSSAEVFEGSYNNQDVAIKKYKYKIPEPHLERFFAAVGMPYFKKTPESAMHEAFKEATNMSHFDQFPKMTKLVGYCLSPPCLVTELIPKGSLAKVMHDEPNLCAKIRFKIAVNLCQSVKIIHDNNRIHSDIKPGNIGLDSDYNAKLIDFGHMTDQVTKKYYGGTLFYLAPEVCAEQKVSVHSDIYSLGLVLFQLMLPDREEFNKLFFEEEEKNKQQIKDGTLNKKINNKLDYMKKRGLCSFEMINIIRRCIQADPAKRPSITEILTLLQPPSRKKSAQKSKTNHHSQSVFSAAATNPFVVKSPQSGRLEPFRILSCTKK